LREFGNLENKRWQLGNQNGNICRIRSSSESLIVSIYGIDPGSYRCKLNYSKTYSSVPLCDPSSDGEAQRAQDCCKIGSRGSPIQMDSKTHPRQTSTRAGSTCPIMVRSFPYTCRPAVVIRRGCQEKEKPRRVKHLSLRDKEWWLSIEKKGTTYNQAKLALCHAKTATILTRINEERIAAGKATIGFVNLTLYANAGAFHDIATGTNPGCGTNG